jgi:hypothetical protein
MAQYFYVLFNSDNALCHWFYSIWITAPHSQSGFWQVSISWPDLWRLAAWWLFLKCTKTFLGYGTNIYPCFKALINVSAAWLHRETLHRDSLVYSSDRHAFCSFRRSSTLVSHNSTTLMIFLHSNRTFNLMLSQCSAMWTICMCGQGSEVTKMDLREQE